MMIFSYFTQRAAARHGPPYNEAETICERCQASMAHIDDGRPRLCDWCMRKEKKSDDRRIQNHE